MIKLLQKAVSPFRRQPLQDFDFSNMDDFQYDVEGEFDVYTLESALPKIDWEILEAHLEATQEEERRRHNDREEIRRQLAMEAEEEPSQTTDHRKLSLQTRLQTGMNLQICFMNETASDCESQCSDTESTQDHLIDYPKTSSCSNFATRQSQLQAEARLALGQAKAMARMQMDVERQRLRDSPVTEIIRQCCCKIGLALPDNKRRLSRQMLTVMNVAQLQVIVNHLHTQIEGLNEGLVRHLLTRDDLHMEQDSRLVDIEDLTNHLAAKERSNSTSSSGTSKSSPSSTSVMSTPSSSSRASPPSSASRTSPLLIPPAPLSAPPAIKTAPFAQTLTASSAK